jgi:hypothetical protein
MPAHYAPGLNNLNRVSASGGRRQGRSFNGDVGFERRSKLQRVADETGLLGLFQSSNRPLNEAERPRGRSFSTDTGIRSWRVTLSP